MKIQITDAQVWWVSLFDEIRPLKAPPPGAIIAEIQREFSFQIVPTSLNVGQGIELQYGTLIHGDEFISVNKLMLYNDGLNIWVPATTTEADLVLDKTLEIVFSMGMREPTTPPSHSYFSNIVADLDCSIDNYFPSSLYEGLNELAPSNGPVHALSIGFQFDPMRIERRAVGLGNPGFRIERREGVPYEMNRYFSAANTTTEKHIELLERFEAGAKSAFSKQAIP